MRLWRCVMCSVPLCTLPAFLVPSQVAAADPPSAASPAKPATSPPQKFDSWTVAADHPDPAQPARYLAYVKSGTGDLFGFGCDKAGQTPVYGILFSHKYLAGGSNPTRDLEYIIDHGRERVTKWAYLEQYAFMRDPDQTRDIAADITAGKSLDVRAFTYELFAVDAHFDITGAKAAIETLYRDCRG